MNETTTSNILMILYIAQLPLLAGACIYNAKTVKKKGRAAAPFVWRTIGLWTAAFLGSMLLWVLLHFPFGRQGFVEGFLTVFLSLGADAASVLIAKRALNEEDERKKRLSRSLRPEHFTNGREFSRSDFEGWVLASRRGAKKALTAYLCCIGGGILLSFLFSEGVGGFGGNVLALLCIFGGLILGGALAKRNGAASARQARRLGITNADIRAAKALLKQGKTARSAEDASAGTETQQGPDSPES